MSARLICFLKLREMSHSCNGVSSIKSETTAFIDSTFLYFSLELTAKQ